MRFISVWSIPFAFTSAARRCRAAALTAVLALTLLAWSPPAAADAATARATFGGDVRSAASPWTRLVLTVRQTQHDLQRRLVGTLREARESGSILPLLTLGLFGFVYGVVHAAGPGHGKIVVSTYLAASESRVRRGVGLAFLGAFVQALAAIALVGAAALLLDFTRLETMGGVRWLELASFALVVLVGLWLAAASAFGLEHRHGHHGHGHGHGHDHGHDHRHEPHEHGHDRHATPRGSLARAAALVLAVGLRPCTGAVIVLLFALGQGMLSAGIAATFAMALGTALTVSALAILSVMSHRLALRLAARDDRKRTVTRWLGTVGGLFVAAVGVLLFTATLDAPATPF